MKYVLIFIRSLDDVSFENELSFGLNFMGSPSENGSGIKLSVQVTKGNREIRPAMYLYLYVQKPNTTSISKLATFIELSYN